MASYVTLGCDPELFITRTAGRVRKRIAAVESGMILSDASHTSVVTRDGVQVELHAGGYSGCRQALAMSIKRGIAQLHPMVCRAQKRLKNPSLQVSFKPMMKLTPGDMAKLSPEARELNCKPSLNAYGREPIFRDGNTYPIRTASGHLHLGNQLFAKSLIDPDDGVRIFDVLIGIPCVLVDQDPSQRIRRETYGRAGEYRLPSHGVEYRVPSNFWLLDYKLMSFVFGLAKLAIDVNTSRYDGTITKRSLNALLRKIDFAQVEQAINENDFDLALRIYKMSIRPFADTREPSCGFGRGLMDAFEYFVDRVHEKGLRHWFDLDEKQVLNRWLDLSSSSVGWERFLLEVVEPRRKNAKFTGIILDPAKVLAATLTKGGVTVRRRSRAIAEAESLRAAA